MENIEVKPHEGWRYFLRNQDELIHIEHLIADNDDFGVEVYIGADCCQGSVFPTVSVTMDGYEVMEETAENEKELEELLIDVYDMYLTDRVFDALSASGDTLIGESELDEREDELDAAALDFLNTVYDGRLDTDFRDFGDVVGEFKEAALEFLAQNYDKHIRRPMYLEAPDGSEFFDSFPYECMTFTA